MPIKFKTASIIFFIVSIAFISSAPQAYAIPVGVIANVVQVPYDIGTLLESTLTTVATQASWILDLLHNIKERVLDPLAWVTSKIQIFEEANTILTQVRGGGNARGETGLQLFVTNWETVARKAVNNQRVFFLQELATTKKIDPAFQETFLGAFSGNPEKSVFNRLQSSFTRDAAIGCPPGQTCNLENFLGDFSKGGWQGWNSIVINPGNNPYRSYLELQAEKARREESARQARLNEALASQGALGTQDCVDEPSPEFVGPPAPPPEENQSSAVEPNQSPAPNVAPAIKKCKITRPGSTVATDLSKVLSRGSDILQQVREFGELFNAAFGGLIGSLRSKGIGSDNDTSDTRIVESQAAVKQANITQSDKTLADLKNSVNKSLGELSAIWEIKVKSLDLVDDIPPGLIYELKVTQDDIDTGGKCSTKPDVFDQLPSMLEEAQQQRDKLADEVGYPVDFSNPINGAPPLGFYENGGAYSENLIKEQSNLEYLDQVLKNNGDIEPSIVASDEIIAIFAKDDNGKSRFSSEERVRMAQQLISTEVNKVSELLTQVGTAASARAEQRGINQKMFSERQKRRVCAIPDS